MPRGKRNTRSLSPASTARRQERHAALESADAELVFGIVCPVGTDYKPVQQAIAAHLSQLDYTPVIIKLSEAIEKINVGVKLADKPELKRITTRIKAANKARRITERPDLMALLAISQISRSRTWSGKDPEPLPRTAHILSTLKRPEEVDTLRKVYGPGFYLVGVFANEEERQQALIGKNVAQLDALGLIERDAEEEDDDFGQRTRDTFHLADFFVRLKSASFEEDLSRFLKLLFGAPHITPTADEQAMFMAYAASLRSGDLARQVGAAITTKRGEVLAVGCNDVPCAGGGLYWPGTNDQRDHVNGFDSNDRRKAEIIEEIEERIRKKFREQSPAAFDDLFRKTSLLDITEFGRAVHAEMDALLTCCRSGVSPRGAYLFTTTFPCHNCTRHIVAAGVDRVVYIEPYPKSRAEALHSDSIRLEEKVNAAPGAEPDTRVPFEPFLGVGPRRFFDLFSMALSTGYRVKRKVKGEKAPWAPKPRVPLLPTSYLHREAFVVREIASLVRSLGTRK